MATATQAQEIIDVLDQKVTQLKEAVDALTKASGRQPNPGPPPTPSPSQASQPEDQNAPK